MKRVVALYRAERFSPNSVEKDALILQSVVRKLNGCEVILMPEATFTADTQADIIVSMARLPQTLQLLKQKEDKGVVVINSGYGVETCARGRLESLMRAHNIPMPPIKGNDGYWVKRADAAAQSDKDIVFCSNSDEVDKAVEAMHARGIKDVVVSAHVVGDLVKFYGVEGTGFFRCYYPNDDGMSKFGNEARNGMAHHYSFNETALQQTADSLSALVRTPVYGGDCIITPSGEYKIIDFNDWPSFSRCREEGANAIVKLLKNEQF